ncbi:DNA/RNA polymerase superfamily protein [Gossypium australe]|uniref:DNA/RNA polymerase superfamily protein n=1 Tax=Gossypium australe TaxID=47621 RepID=A0A5B6UVN9_9ROSI|nr:DNA/RNA polymerase superfamily protein [Gossypium australe]
MKRKDIEFQVGYKVFLKVSSWKRILCFGRKGKLSPRFIGPYEIIERIGSVAYRLEVPSKLEKIHNVFHYRSDPSHIISPTEVEIQPDMSNKRIALVKVLWHRHGIEEATWEPEETMRKQYPNLFSSKLFEDKKS